MSEKRMQHMSEKLRVSFNSPQCGWMSFELRAGEQSLINAVSSVRYDSLRDLIRALSRLLYEDAGLTVKWAYEPDEVDFNFKARGERAALEVKWYKNHLRLEGAGERVFFYEGARLGLCHPFWEALRDMQSDMEVDEFARNWGREFPASEMQQLAEDITAYRREQARRTDPSAS
ncbi:MAG TPA: hypothetical protein VEZ40_00820 [Pyrinomonadaceae bacterium]|nr:hypothetical protein [Pyrinomonadaceae bacterium]